MTNRKRRKKIIFASGPRVRRKRFKIKVGGRKQRRRKLSNIRTRILKRALGVTR